MTQVIRLDAIREVLPRLDLVRLMEEGFVAYSAGRAVVPPVGELLFEDPPGDTHIKYGFIRGGDHFVIKVASGFYDNPGLGLSSSQGVVLLFSQKTGAFEAALLDEGHLTDVRTAAAGAVAARQMAPTQPGRIGVLGGGIQARLQLVHLRGVVSCRRALVWMRDAAEFETYRNDFAGTDYEIELADSPQEVTERCRLIVTATASQEPLLAAEWIRPGTHITAVGSDTAAKVELEPGILAAADRVVVDSLPQSESRGEVFRAVEAGVLLRDSVVELGSVIAGDAVGRSNDTEVTVCDLTGVAVQDLMIAQGVIEEIQRPTEERK